MCKRRRIITYRVREDIQRLVLLNRFEGLSYAEIGEQFGMSAENVRKHIERTLAECLRALRG